MPNWRAASELWLHRMIAEIEDRVAAVGTFSPEGELWGALPAFSLNPCATIAERVLRRLPGVGRSRSPLERWLAQPGVDTVLSNYLDVTLAVLGGVDLTGKRLFVHCHGYDVNWALKNDAPPHEPYFGPEYLPAVLRLSERATFIANSRSTARKLKLGGVPEERVRVKYYGVPAPSVPPARGARTSGVEVLYLGRLVDFKGPEQTIRAFEIACGAGFDGRLTLAGDGPLRSACERLVNASRFRERISLTGAVSAEEGERLRSAADIFTAHSCIGGISNQEEALGVAFLEASAAALPVVTGRTSALEETIVPDETGVFFDPGDVEAQARVLVALGRDPELRARLGLAGWRRVREHFSVEREKDELLKILDWQS